MKTKYRQYKRLMGKNPGETQSNILIRHRPAWDDKHKPCSLPITQEKADRIARALHRVRGV